MNYLMNFDWLAIVKIIFLDILLGGDNAIVIALACSAVPVGDRKKALLGGTAAAVLARAVFLALATFLITIPYLKIIAGLMLLWIGFKLLASGDDDDGEVTAKDKIFAAIMTIAVADIMMSIDNVFAITGVAQETAHGLLYSIVGIVISIPAIVFGASIITKFMDKFPVITWVGGGLLGWVGAEMIIGDAFMKGLLSTNLPDVHHVIFKMLGTAIVLLAAGSAYFYQTQTEKVKVQHG